MAVATQNFTLTETPVCLTAAGYTDSYQINIHNVPGVLLAYAASSTVAPAAADFFPANISHWINDKEHLWAKVGTNQPGAKLTAVLFS